MFKTYRIFVFGSLLAAGIAFLVACGEGDVVEFPDIYDEVFATGDALQNKIGNGDIAIVDEPNPPPPPPPPEESSSSEYSDPGVSSSDGGNVTESSSSYNSGSTSSSSNTQPTGSSSSYVPPPPSSGNPTNNCSVPGEPTGCKWDNDKPLPGGILKPVATAACDNPEWSYNVNNFGNSCISVDPDVGIVAQSGSYNLYVKCGGGATKTCGTVSPKKAPSLSGNTCKWSKNPTTPENAAAASFKPTGIELSDPDRICPGANVSYRIKGGADDWPPANITDGDYNVEAYVNCSAYDVGTKDCETLKVTSILYEISAQNDRVIVPSGEAITITMNMPERWHNETEGNCTFFCQIDRQGGDGMANGKVDGKTISGSDHVTVKIPINSTINNYNLPVEITAGGILNCGIGW